MSTTTPTRANGQTIEAGWFNVLKTSVEELRIIPLTVTVDKTVGSDANLIIADPTAGDIDLTLPSAAINVGKFYFLAALNITNDVVVLPNGSETIDGAASFTFTHANQAIRLDSDGTNWKITSNYIDEIDTLKTVSFDQIDLRDDTTHKISISAPASSADYSLVLPDVQGAAGNTLLNDGSGNLSWGEGGGSGAGSLETIFSESFETNSPTDLVIGNNNDATFLGTSGTPGGAISDETTTPINGAHSLKYVGSATAADNTDDWVANPSNIATTAKMRGNTCGINLWYTWSGTNDYFKVVVWDVTNSVALSESNWYLKNTSVPSLFSSSFFVPASCNNIRVGVQCITGEVSKILVLDDVTISTDPFVYKDLMATQSYAISQNGNAMTDITGHLRFNLATATVNQNTGAGVFTVTDNGTATVWTALKDCRMSLHASGPTGTNTGTTSEIHIYKNGTTVLIGGSNGYPNSSPQTSSLSIDLKAGEYLSLYAVGNIYSGTIPLYAVASAIAESEHVITPAKSGIEEIYYDGFSSRSSTSIKFKTQQRSTLSQIASVDNSSYTLLTLKKKAIVLLKVQVAGTSLDLGIVHKNSSGTQVSTANVTVPSTYYGGTFIPIIANAGDTIYCTGTANPTDNSLTAFSAVFVDFEQQMLSALPQPSSIDVSTANGYGSSATTIRKYSGTPVIVGGDISYTSDATNGDSFTINKTGSYTVSLNDSTSSTGSASIGFLLNSTTVPNGFIAGIYVSAAASIATVTRTLRLTKGDVLRIGVDSAARFNATTGISGVSITRVGW